MIVSGRNDNDFNYVPSVWAFCFYLLLVDCVKNVRTCPEMSSFHLIRAEPSGVNSVWDTLMRVYPRRGVSEPDILELSSGWRRLGDGACGTGEPGSNIRTFTETQREPVAIVEVLAWLSAYKVHEACRS